VTTASSIEQQYYTSSIYGEWCNAAVKNDFPDGYHVTTPAVAQDLLTFIEADARAAGKPTEEAKLWAYGISYGTVTGTTFASMFPDRVGRMVLDGVMDADKYYSNDWEDTVESMDETLEMFSSLCHSAGPDACAFYGPSPENITVRIDNIVQQLQSQPVPISGAETGGLPMLVTYADLKSLFINALYQPLVTFPALAEALSGIENDNISSLVGVYDSQGVFDDVRLRIQCADSYRNNELSTLDEFKSYVEYTTSKSKYAGDAYPMFLGNILCRSMEPQLSDSMVAQGPISAETSFPIIFASNTVDGLTPLKA
jgi:pimeloyl-ACP methyl ester carboxylesterase